MKNHIYTFSRFSRVYEDLSQYEEEEQQLKALYRESLEKFEAELGAGTADGMSFLTWVETVCDIADSTKMRGVVVAQFRKDMDRLTPDLLPLWKEISMYRSGSAEDALNRRIRTRLGNLGKASVKAASSARERLSKLGLRRDEN